MIGWIILSVVGGLVLLVLVLSMVPIKATVEYSEKFTGKIKYLFFTLYDSEKPKKTKKRKKKKKRKKAKKKSQKQKLTQKIKKQSGVSELVKDFREGGETGFDLELFRILYDAAKAPLKKLIRKTSVTNVVLRSVIAGDDAMTTALNYGVQSAAINGLLAWANEIVTLKIKELKITADFSKDAGETYFRFNARVKAGSVLVFLLKCSAAVADSDNGNKKNKKITGN